MQLKPRPEYLPALVNPGRSHVGYESEESHPFLSDDFLGDTIDRKWEVHTAGNGTVDHRTGLPGGVVQLSTSSVDQLETASLYFANQYALDLHRGLIFEFRARFRGNGGVVPAQHDIVAGVGGQHNSTSDNWARSAWFRWEPGRDTLIETDDTSNNLDDVETGHKLSDIAEIDARWVTYKIDFENMEDVRFYVDGKRLLGQDSNSVPVTLDMSNLTDTEAIMQPVFKVRKLGGSSTSFELDYVKAWHRRGSVT